MVYTAVKSLLEGTESRVLLFLIQLFIGFVLLANIKFEDTFTRVGDNYSIIAGLGPFDPTIQNGDPTELFLSDTSLLENPLVAVDVLSPNGTTCEECHSYILPGTLQGIAFVASGNTPQQNSSEGGTSFIAQSAPGYRFDFYPLHDVIFPSSACKIYGKAVELCLMNVDGDLVAGIIPSV